MSERLKELYERLDTLYAEAGPYGEEFHILIDQLASAHRRADETTWRTVQSWLRLRKSKATQA